MLGWRLLLSAILIPALIGLFVLDARMGAAAPVLFVLCLLMAIRGCVELAELLRRPALDPSVYAMCAATTGLLALTWWPRLVGEAPDPSWRIVTALALGVIGLFLYRAWRYREPGPNVPTLAAEVLGLCYIGLLLCLTAQLRWIGDGAYGYLALGSLIIAAKMGDVGAYTLGRLFGKRKMAPRLSPGKTWMGAMGALVGGALGAVVWLTWLGPLVHEAWPPAPLIRAALYGATIGLAGLFGDLCESLLKRDAGVKDSAPLLPGFGGLLDLLDSVLFAGPIAWILWESFPIVTNV